MRRYKWEISSISADMSKRRSRMHISERQQQILKILEKDTFTTVQQLADSTFTSPSSIRRDLTVLQTQGLVSRTHGGATLRASGVQAPALHSRMSKNVSEKRKIAKTASSLLHDDMSVMLDGSSTASFLLPVCFIACTTLGTRVSETAAQNDAHRLLISSSSPTCSAWWIRFSVAVFNPEKLIS